MNLPPTLLEAIAAPEGGRVVLIIGAGSSLEQPTCLPLARECSREAHRKLVADGILSNGDCGDPDDLSVMADTVKAKTGGQAQLVRRLPITKFKNAKPNNGHLITTALMLEGAITNVVTLNFDLALNHALSDLAAENEVSIIKGPEEHNRLSRTNIIYLHRNAETAHEDWILTTEALDQAWRDNWEEVITRFAMAAPVTVFTGLGSPCGVLKHSVKKLRMALANEVNVYLANPGRVEDSPFARELEIEATKYISLGWVDFMRMLSDRVVLEITNRVSQSCADLINREGWPPEDVEGLCNRLKELGLVSFGVLRASWFLDKRKYAKMENLHADLIADLLLLIGMLERIQNTSASLSPNGLVEFRSATQSWSFRATSGRGVRRWSSIEAEIRQFEKYNVSSRKPRLRNVLVSGISGSPQAITPPASIVGTSDEKSILDGDMILKLFSADDIRNDANKIKEMFA